MYPQHDRSFVRALHELGIHKVTFRPYAGRPYGPNELMVVSIADWDARRHPPIGDLVRRMPAGHVLEVVFEPAEGDAAQPLAIHLGYLPPRKRGRRAPALAR